MMQRRLQKASPRGQASGALAVTNKKGAAAAVASPVRAAASSSPKSAENVQPVGYLPHFARQTKSSLQRNALRANDNSRAPLSNVTGNFTTSPATATTSSSNGSNKKATVLAATTTTPHSQHTKIQKPGFLSSFVNKRAPPAARKVPPPHHPAAGPSPAAHPATGRVLGISPPWQQKKRGETSSPQSNVESVPTPKSNVESVPTPKSAVESKPRVSHLPRLTVNTSPSSASSSPTSEPSTERLGISPVWPQQPEQHQPSSDRTPTALAIGNSSADVTTPSSLAMATLLGVFSTHADVWVQPTLLEDTASNASLEDVPLSVLVRARESLGGVSEISDGSTSVSLETSSEVDDDEESTSTLDSLLSSQGSSAAPSQASSTTCALSLGRESRTDFEDEDDDDDDDHDNEALLQLPKGLLVPQRDVVAPLTSPKLDRQNVHALSEDVDESTNLLLSPPQVPAVAVEQYLHGMPSICVGRLLQGADDDSSEDRSTSTLRSDLDKFLSTSIFSPAEAQQPADDDEAIGHSFLPEFPVGVCQLSTLEGGTDDSFLLSDEALPFHAPTVDETPVIDDAVRMFTVEDCDSMTLFADLSGFLDDESILSIVSDPLRLMVETNLAFLTQSQHNILTDPLPVEKCFGAAYGGRTCSSMSASSESVPALLPPVDESGVVTIEGIRSLPPFHQKGLKGLYLDAAVGADDPDVSSSDVDDRDSSTESSTAEDLPPSPSDPAAPEKLTQSESHEPEPLSDGESECSSPSDDSRPSDESLRSDESTDKLSNPCLDEMASPSDKAFFYDNEEIRMLRGQVEQLVQNQEELEHLLEVALKELVATSTIYTSGEEALHAIRTKAREQKSCKNL